MLRHSFSSAILLFSVTCLLIQSLMALEVKPYARHRHHHRSSARRHRQIPLFPERNEQSPAYCGHREHHVMCGPERHCDKSCDNMFSPPHCLHYQNPKCYFPRCVCNEGYVRGPLGHCIKPSRCPNRYMEPKSEDEDLLVEFKPIRFRNHKVRRVRHRRPDLL